MYELILIGVDSKFLKEIDTLKYTKTSSSNNYNNELLTVRFSYKEPKEYTSKEIVRVLRNVHSKNNTDFNFAAAIAMWGMYLRDSEYLNERTKEEIIKLAEANKDIDKEGYRAEFIRLIKSYNYIPEKESK